jgi:hypothetical protein
MRLSFLGWSLAGLTAAATPAPQHGLKIVVRETFPAGMVETTEYMAGDRARTEVRSSSRSSSGTVEEHGYVQIRRCDLDTLVVLNAKHRTYHSGPLHPSLNAIERVAFALGRRSTEPQGPPEIVVETTTFDTGERKIAFNHAARRVVITRRQVDLRRSEPPTETVTDGWYIDLETRPSCQRGRGSGGRAVLVAVASPAGAQAHSPRVSFKDTGAAEEGFAIETTTTSRSARQEGPGPAGAAVTHRRVTHLSHQALDTSLFDVPDGFRSADARLGALAARWSQTAHIVGSVIASWFR